VGATSLVEQAGSDEMCEAFNLRCRRILDGLHAVQLVGASHVIAATGRGRSPDVLVIVTGPSAPVAHCDMPRLVRDNILVLEYAGPAPMKEWATAELDRPWAGVEGAAQRASVVSRDLGVTALAPGVGLHRNRTAGAEERALEQQGHD